MKNIRFVRACIIALTFWQMSYGDVIVPSISTDENVPLAEFSAVEGRSFQVSIVGDISPDSSVAWFHNGRPLATAANVDTLILSPTSWDDSGLYYAVVVSSGNSGTKSQSFVLNVAPAPRMANSSSRMYVLNGGEPAILGIVSDSGAASGYSPQILVRVIGPSLQPFGVLKPLPQPKATLYGGNVAVPDATFSANGNTNLFIKEATAKVGAFPLKDGTQDLALLFRATPGIPYTVVVSSDNGTDGTVLIEAYQVPE